MWIFILIPIFWVAITKLIWLEKISFKECAIHLGSVLPTTAIIFAISYYGSVGDTEILNGQVTNKVRDNSSHQESYSCNCVESCSGSGSSRSCTNICQTCYRTVYTVDWKLSTTIGSITIDYASSYSSAVWLYPNPKIYDDAVIGERCAKSHIFTNYIKGAPNSLFNQASYTLKQNYQSPAYPQIYNIYKVNNVIGEGINLNPYQELVAERLKTMGIKKEVNIILIFTKNKDKNYRYTVEKEWIGGKKNDVVILIGLDDKKVLWSDAFTFGLSEGNFLMISEIKDILNNNEISTDLVGKVLDKVEHDFKRKHMADFEYLSKSIQPSSTLMIFVFVLQLLANIGITYFNIKNEA